MSGEEEVREAEGPHRHPAQQVQGLSSRSVSSPTHTYPAVPYLARIARLMHTTPPPTQPSALSVINMPQSAFAWYAPFLPPHLLSRRVVGYLPLAWHAPPSLLPKPAVSSVTCPPVLVPFMS